MFNNYNKHSYQNRYFNNDIFLSDFILNLSHVDRNLSSYIFETFFKVLDKSIKLNKNKNDSLDVLIKNNFFNNDNITDNSLIINNRYNFMYLILSYGFCLIEKDINFNFKLFENEYSFNEENLLNIYRIMVSDLKEMHNFYNEKIKPIKEIKIMSLGELQFLFIYNVVKNSKCLDEEIIKKTILNMNLHSFNNKIDNTAIKDENFDVFNVISEVKEMLNEQKLNGMFNDSLYNAVKYVENYIVKDYKVKTKIKI